MNELPVVVELHLHLDSVGGFFGATIAGLFFVFFLIMHFFGRSDEIVKSYIGYNLVMFFYLLGYAIYASGHTLETVDFWTRVCYSGVAFIPLVFRHMIDAIMGGHNNRLNVLMAIIGLFWFVLIWSRSDWVITTLLKPDMPDGHPSMIKGWGFYLLMVSVLIPVVGCWVRFVYDFFKPQTNRNLVSPILIGFSIWVLSSVFDGLVAAGLLPGTKPLLWLGPAFMLVMMGVYFARFLRSQIEHSENLAKEKDDIYQLMIRDDLTSLYSRNYIDSVLRHEMEKLKRYPAEHSLLFIDIDDFKKINDQLGHRVGDQLLLNLGNIIRTYTRTSDVAARYGGDEFLILLLNCTDEQAMGLAYRISQNYTQSIHQISSHVFGKLPGLSIGISSSRYWNAEPEDVIAQADFAMYRAKSTGKNKIMHVVGRSADFHWQVAESQILKSGTD